ncbi:MAG: SAM-dependent chlorinase/fluorinase [Candidatus Melainabacteria bacterium]|nr:SAM-dependent chlorinase/fluorinase [Candidatus Melainabacteria bacterium]
MRGILRQLTGLNSLGKETLSRKTTIVTLTTDFGSADGYTGIVKGVILGIAPKTVIVDITHEVKPWDLRAAGWILGNSYKYFPRGSIHVVVVDPGVGTDCRPLVVVCSQAIFIAPDNGVLSWVLKDCPHCQAYELTSSKFWLNPVSNTFHARDIYAPIAAHLAKGVSPQRLATPIDSQLLIRLPCPSVRIFEDWLIGEVVHVDHFGNLVTNIPGDLAMQARECVVGDCHIGAITKTYASVTAGTPTAIIGSHGFIEIVVCQGMADSVLGLGVGEPIKVKLSATYY